MYYYLRHDVVISVINNIYHEKPTSNLKSKIQKKKRVLSLEINPNQNHL